MQDRWALAYAREGPQCPHPHWIEPPPGHFYADPFLVERNGQPWVFFEDFSAATGRGQIAASPLLQPDPQPALCLDWHLSYPYLVEFGEELFCIPEQHERNQVSLYRCLEFPGQWTQEAVLLDGFAGVDPTVIWWDESWWMWLGDQRRRARDHVFLFSAPSLTGPWREHRQSPAILRHDLARPGGKPWLEHGRWMRPAQNRSRTYGGGLVVYAVEVLSHDTYCESEQRRWDPLPHWPYPDGLHHVCRLGEWTCWDAKRFVEEL